MPIDASVAIAGLLAGAGATVLIDLWALVLRRTFGIPSLNLCLLGRWVLHMPHGTFVHDRITSAAAKAGECAAGWISHYAIGLTLGLAFALAVPGVWWTTPTLAPAVAFGIITVVMPLFVMQPALGLGVASARTPNPAAARARSLATHTVFGLGLYGCGKILSRWMFGG